MDEKMEKLRAALRESLQVPVAAPLEQYASLSAYTWDSFAWVTTMAAIEEYFGVLVEARKLADCKTVHDIYELARGGK